MRVFIALSLPRAARLPSPQGKNGRGIKGEGEKKHQKPKNELSLKNTKIVERTDRPIKYTIKSICYATATKGRDTQQFH